LSATVLMPLAFCRRAVDEIFPFGSNPGNWHDDLNWDPWRVLADQKSQSCRQIAASAEIQVDPRGADKLFAMECAFCHGGNGPREMDVGGWMNPRAVDLSSAGVQRYSDRELFWIVKNGIRLTGMPAFGKVETDEHIWKLVHYLRILTIQPK
jgi:mono/diheme cytochrome c family protein